MSPSTGPTIMGIDVVMVASALSAVATFAVLVAIYAATTVRDPMAKRVKALNERREQLKAGIVASTSKRRKNITNRNEMADKVRGLLASLKMLQDEQVEKAQAKLMQAGIRSKDLAFVVIFARLRAADRARRGRDRRGLRRRLFPGLGRVQEIRPRRRHPAPRLQGAGPVAEEQGRQAHQGDPQGPARRARPARSSAPRPASPSTPPSAASPASSARPIPSSATNSP